MLIRSVDVNEHQPAERIRALARKSDGLILHDRVLDSEQLADLARHVQVVTLAGAPTAATANVRGDNAGGMRQQPIRELATVAFELLFAMINREPPASRNVVLPTTLVRRESCGCAPGETGRTER
jgi:DNA-binding LacI/PurR family transcriptional regulator